MPVTKPALITITLRSFLIPTVRASDLARRAGVSRQYVGAVLRGERPPSDKLLTAAAELGIPVSFEETLESAKPAVAGLRAPRNNNRDRDYTPLPPAH
jgi:transcriptional regulator with XRE-family HTH domain